MTTQRRARDVLPHVLSEMAQGSYPDYLDDVLATTVRKRQRPAWTFLERWLPMADLARALPAPATRLPWRQIGLAIIVLALLIAGLVMYVGSQRALPAPFGPAGNGLLAFASEGDIYTADLVTGKATAVISGPETDLGPRFSLDGSRIVFERRVAGVESELWTARPDGGDLRVVTPRPVILAPGDYGRAWEKYEFSPDGETILIATMDGDVPTVTIAQADGTGVRTLDPGMPATEPSFRPPDGAEVLFVSDGPSGGGVFAVDPITGRVRQIVETKSGRNIAGASWSPDGSRVAYWTWDPAASGMTARSHVVNADGTGDRELPMPPDAVWNAHATWSNDGTRLFIARGHTPEFEDVRGVVLPADGSSFGAEVSGAGFVETGCCAAWMWSPDDTKLIGRSNGYHSAPFHHVVIDAVAGSARLTPWQSTGDPSWQRLAP